MKFYSQKISTKYIIYFFLILISVSCTAKIEVNTLGFKELKNNILLGNNYKTDFYEIEFSENKNEKDIWINSKNKNIYDTILKLYNLKYKTTFSDTVFNSWTTDSSELMLYQKSDSLVLITILKNN